MKWRTRLFNLFRHFFRIPFLERYIRKRTIGKPLTSFWAKLVPSQYQYPPGSIREFSHNGIWLSVDIHDYIGHYLYFGFYDDSVEALLSLIRKDDVVIDVGTNIGYVLLRIAQKIGENGFVFGYEPEPKNFQICLDCIRKNGVRNVHVENVGLGREEGRYLMIVNPLNRAGSRIALKEPRGEEIVEIPVTTLDREVRRKGLTRIDVIKIDVEGFEPYVIKGGIETIKTFRPKLFFEVDEDNLKRVGSSPNELIALLEQLNYKVYHALTGERLTPETDFSKCHFDAIGLPAEKE